MPTQAAEPGPPKISLHQAVTAANHFFRTLYTSPSVANVLLEEVEETDGDWLITLGFDTDRIVHQAVPAVLANVIPERKEMIRVYKTFVIDGKSGNVRAMKMHPNLSA